MHAHRMCVCAQNTSELKQPMKPTFSKANFQKHLFHELLNEKRKIEIKYSEISYTKNIADIVEHNGSNSYLAMTPILSSTLLNTQSKQSSVDIHFEKCCMTYSNQPVANVADRSDLDVPAQMEDFCWSGLFSYHSTTRRNRHIPSGTLLEDYPSYLFQY